MQPGRLLYRSLLFVLLALVGLLLVTAAGAVAWDGERRSWDVQTFALLVSGIGYFVARLAGVRRTTAVETAFVSSIGASLYASLTQPGNKPLITFVIGACVVASLAWLMRRLEWAFADALSFTPSPHPTRVPVKATTPVWPNSPAPSSRSCTRALLAAAIGSALGILLSRIVDRAR
ncbi:MAG: hypothetical protein M3Q08_12425 [Pseudomonadota bacterium]|nr:hypothetical protein [Pseudomonadota bacterium]